MEKYDIFISYSRKDKYQVDKIVDILKFRGYKVWIDIDGIESGEAFRKTIVEAIENSSIMIFFSSDASNKSKWTTKEISLGVEYNMYLIPIKLDKASYNKSIIFDLIDLDYIDMSEERLVDASVQKLMRTIISKIGTRDLTDSDNYARTIIAVPKASIYEENGVEPGSKTFLQKFLQCWESRNVIVNCCLSGLVIMAFCALFVGFLVGFPFWPAALTGLFGLYLLFFNKKDGIAFVVGAGLLWTLANAFETCPSCTVFRFFQDGHFLMAWFPLLISILTVSLLAIKKDGIRWVNKCKPISTIAIILLTIAVGLWVWAIYFDCVTKLGLPPNLRHYIDRVLN